MGRPPVDDLARDLQDGSAPGPEGEPTLSTFVDEAGRLIERAASVVMLVDHLAERWALHEHPLQIDE